jgi:predicted dehydrogenase
MPFGGGVIGDWICHVLDPAYWALELGAPTSVRAEVFEYNPETQGLTYPAATKITFEFPARKDRPPVQFIWYDGNAPIPRPENFPATEKIPETGAILFGDKGMIVHGSHGAANCKLLPAELMEQFSGKNAPAEKLPRIQGHGWDWADAIRNGRAAGSNFDYGGPLTQVALIGLIAIRFPNQTLQWDNKAMKFTNHKAATALVNSVYRSGWKV